MIDIHSHILYGLDDGAQTLEESIEMCRISFYNGVRTVVATPHTHNGVYENSRTAILAKVQELNAILPDLTNPINLKIIPGADVHFSEAALLQIYQDEIMTVADGGKFLLLEFPSQGIPYRAEAILYQLLVRGITPIISHPERNLEILHWPQRYIQMVEMGCLGQISAGSLVGGFGRDVRQTAEILLRKNLVHFIASDGHSADGRPPVLSPEVRTAAKIVGEEQARRMVTEYPQAIIEGRRPKVPEPREIAL